MWSQANESGEEQGFEATDGVRGPFLFVFVGIAAHKTRIRWLVEACESLLHCTC